MITSVEEQASFDEIGSNSEGENDGTTTGSNNSHKPVRCGEITLGDFNFDDGICEKKS